MGNDRVPENFACLRLKCPGDLNLLHMSASSLIAHIAGIFEVFVSGFRIGFDSFAFKVKYPEY